MDSCTIHKSVRIIFRIGQIWINLNCFAVDFQKNRFNSIKFKMVIIGVPVFSSDRSMSHFIDYFGAIIDEIYQIISDLCKYFDQITIGTAITRLGDFIIIYTTLFANPITEILSIGIDCIILIFVSAKCNHF